MPNLIERVSIITQAIRTLLAVVVVGGLGTAGWYGYRLVDSRDRTQRELADAREELDRRREQVSTLEATIVEKDGEIDRLTTAMRLLKVDHRVALLSVLEQETNPESGQLESLIEFQELDDRGEPLDAPRQFRIQGDIVYIDSWIVKFDDKYIEEADLHRSTSLVLFRRVFGSDQRPSDAFALDREGTRPGIYGRGGRMSEFERQIWSDFWAVANDVDKQAELGIRAAHGDAPSIKVEVGRTYRITLRASDGLSVSVERSQPPARRPPV